VNLCLHTLLTVLQSVLTTQKRRLPVGCQHCLSPTSQDAVLPHTTGLHPDLLILNMETKRASKHGEIFISASDLPLKSNQMRGTEVRNLRIRKFCAFQKTSCV
jgi:hypothetical protein